MSDKDSQDLLSQTSLHSGNGAGKKMKKPEARRAPDAASESVTGIHDLALNLDGTSFFPPEFPVLRISRNKHWRYVSSFHGPWLSLPSEMLESLLVSWTSPMPLTMDAGLPKSKRRRGLDLIPHPLDQPPSMTLRAAPPPIDPGVFRNAVNIRRLIDDAGELAMRASEGVLSYRQRNRTMRVPPDGSIRGGHRASMSNVHCQRLRVEAVQKISQAYLLDEIVTSVMIMKGTSALDDLAATVLKNDPNNICALYVNFFHEKIPSSPRQLCDTDTRLLDHLIEVKPEQLEYWRTRGIVHTFRDEFPEAIKDFTHGLSHCRAIRKARQGTDHGSPNGSDLPNMAKKGKDASRSTAPFAGEEADIATLLGSPVFPIDATSGFTSPFSKTHREYHPSSLPDAPDPLELQFLFQRGIAQLMNACSSIEQGVFRIEMLPIPPPEGPDIRLSRLDFLSLSPKYGGVELGNPAGPLGLHDGSKSLAYQAVLSEVNFRESIYVMLRKAIRDLDRFLSHFDTIVSPEALTKMENFGNAEQCMPRNSKGKQKVAMKQNGIACTVPTRSWEDLTLEERVDFAYFMIESLRSSTTSGLPTPLPERLTYLASSFPVTYTSYHPLLVESHFAVLICYLMLGEIQTACHRFVQTAIAMDGFDGHPVFLPSRSMAQADFSEVLERLVGGWRCGLLPPSASWRATGVRAPCQAHRPVGVGEPSSSTGQRTPSSSYHPDDKGELDKNGNASDPLDFESLVALRMLMAPVWRRQREKRGRAAAQNPSVMNGGMPVIALHGPRVDVILAWLGAVHLPKFEAAAVKGPPRLMNNYSAE
ncbi:uncharacterized protein EI90DRAFT_3152679 [Cantharellus anzutake]|uniref:uncharacterized protein n=1 Tax=Cantharellus anzutake TaxID=1750568 RepID=UPI0019033A24|nr:uncharacterized protein EI90DRAFT_3152679 [Cantharellus anzutake]KAF8336559.1 hypothetical protein EI90DRAFT_3152679 [Cantharellus anzutake]